METKIYGSIRKTKAWGACGVVLATAFLSMATATTAKANEVATSDNPATNLIAAQPATPTGNLTAQAQAGQQTGDITAPVEATALDNAVAAAQTAGVLVEETAKVTTDSLAAANADLATQASKVEAATDTQKEVATTLTEAKTAATKAGVELPQEAAVTYKNQNEAALTDAAKQAGTLATATAAQLEIDSKLPAAIQEAEQAGVAVATETVAKTQEVAAALADLNKQMANLNTATATQREIDAILAQAVAEAKRAGVTVNAGPGQTLSDVATALANAREQVAALAQAQTAQTEANAKIAAAEASATEAGVQVNSGTVKAFPNVTEAQAAATAQVQQLAQAVAAQAATNKTLSEAEAAAQASGATVTNTGTLTLTATEAQAKAMEIAETLKQIASDNAVISATNAAAQQAYETEKARVDAENAEIEASNAEIDKQNAAKLAEYNAAFAEFNAKAGQLGYPTKGVENKLTILSEPGATISSITSLSGNPTKLTAAAIDLVTDGGAVLDISIGGDASTNLKRVKNENMTASLSSQGARSSSEFLLLNQGDSIKVTHENLTNSSFAGQPISKIEMTYTLKQAPSDFAVLHVDNDPTNTATIAAPLASEGANKETILGVDIQLFDSSGNKIVIDDTSKALTYLGSLNNRSDGGTHGIVEGVRLPSDTEAIEFVGSSIKNHNGTLYSDLQNSYKNALIGLDFNGPADWDGENNASSYYGAALAQFTKDISFDIYIQNTLLTADVPSAMWFTIKNTVFELPEFPKLDRARPTTPSTITPPTPTALKDGETKSIQVVAESSKVQLVAEVSDITVAAQAHDIKLVTPVHDVVIATDVHKVEVTQAPGNLKAVENTEGVDINGKLVAKGSTVHWELSDEALKAGRDYTIDFIREDVLPAGFTVNVAATAEASPAFKVSYDDASRLLRFVANADTIDSLNADLSRSVKLPISTVIGVVENDGATYKNTFTTIITSSETVIRDNNGKLIPNGKTTTYTKVSNTPVIYTPGSDYRTNKGNVVVRYFTTEDGVDVKIAPNQVDVEDAAVGTGYDTTDQKDPVIAFEGKTYKVTTKVVGQETGQVTDGTIFVDYYYDLVPVVPGKGDVLVHFVNEDGDKIANDRVDTPEADTGTPYDTTDNKPKTIRTEDGIDYELVPNKTIGQETGEVIEGTTEVTYVYKRLTPKPETPTPHDNLIQPEKHIYTADGQQIDGKTILPNTKVHYIAVFDNDQFKGMVASKEDVAKGIAYFDDLSDNTVTIDVANITNTLADGSAVTELKATRYASLLEAPQLVQEMAANSGVKLEGDFIVWLPEDPMAFYNKYIVTGLKIYHTLPVITGDYTGTFTNKVWQVVFGNGYAGNIVENNIPKLEALKDAVKSIGSNESVANGKIALGQTFPYVLDGPAIKNDIAGGLNKYVFRDNIDERYDEYNAEFYMLLQKDLKNKAGVVYKSGDELTRFVTQNLERDESGRVTAVTFTVNQDFLDSLAEGETFDPAIYMVVKRIAYADVVENTFTVTINDYEVVSNTVKTHTPKPEDPKPETPKPEAPKPQTPAPGKPETPTQARTLPNTGSQETSVGLVAGMMAMVTALGLSLKKRRN